MKSFVASALLFSGVAFGQYDWDCNHYSLYTTDVCYQYSSSYQYYFECNGTDSISWYDYTDGSCGETDETIYATYTYSGTSSTLWQCDQSSACDYFVLRYYSDAECSGDSYYDSPYISGQCYEISSASSYMYSCSGSKFTWEVFSSSDCSGSSSSTSFTINDAYNDNFSGCYMVCTRQNKK